MDIFGVSPKSAWPSYSENKNNGIGTFECNICFDIAQDPVVTLCSHLFCWPCLYKWLQSHLHSHECPVCKSLVKGDNLVPIYGRGTSNSNLRAHPLSKDEIPSRPASRRPPTAMPPNLTYSREDNIVSPGNSTDYGEDSGVPDLLSSYGHGGIPYHTIYTQGANTIFLKMCFLFLALLVVLVLILC